MPTASYIGLFLALGSFNYSLGCAVSVAEMSRRNRFHIPQTRVVAKSEPRRFPGWGSPRYRLPGYLSHLSTLGGDIENAFPQAKEVETVLYPFSGTDAALAFLLFPNARQVIAIDNHPFVESVSRVGNTFRVIPNYGPPAAGFVPVHKLDELTEVGSRTLGMLSVSIPQVRLRRVQLIEREEKGVYRTHGICDFDTGNGTPLRRLIQLNLEITAENSTEDSWLPRELLRVQPQAIILKSGMVREMWDQTSRFWTVLNSVLENGEGLFVEGKVQRPYGSSYEVSGMNVITGSNSREFSNYLWGYQHGVRVTSFH